jgi:hypothetical protein
MAKQYCIFWKSSEKVVSCQKYLTPYWLGVARFFVKIKAFSNGLAFEVCEASGSIEVFKAIF